MLHGSQGSQGELADESAGDVLERLFEALSHFAGEDPALAQVAALLTADACVHAPGATEPLTRGAWLFRLAADAAERRLRDEGYFVEERARSRVTSRRGVWFVSELVARSTRGGEEVTAETIRCELLLRRVQGRLAIARVTFV